MPIATDVPRPARRILLVEGLCIAGIGLAAVSMPGSEYPAQLMMLGLMFALLGIFAGTAVGLMGNMAWPGGEWMPAAAGSITFAAVYGLSTIIRDDHFWYDGVGVHVLGGMTSAWIAGFVMARFAKRVTRGTSLPSTILAGHPTREA